MSDNHFAPAHTPVHSTDEMLRPVMCGVIMRGELEEASWKQVIRSFVIRPPIPRNLLSSFSLASRKQVYEQTMRTFPVESTCSGVISVDFRLFMVGEKREGELSLDNLVRVMVCFD
jgi:hypothetical protein